MKKIRIQKLLTISYPITAIILGFVFGYASVFFGPYIDGIAQLSNQGNPTRLILDIIQYIGFISGIIILILSVLQDYVTNKSILFSLFGLFYLGSLSYFSLSILEIIITFTNSI